MSLEKYVYSASVIGVHDGDTMSVNVDLGFGMQVAMTLRLSRIDTPELRAPTYFDGAAARDFVKFKILGKQVIVKTTKDKKEKYGRYLAEVFYPNKDGAQTCLNDELVEEGFAIYREY